MAKQFLYKHAAKRDIINELGEEPMTLTHIPHIPGRTEKCHHKYPSGYPFIQITQSLVLPETKLWPSLFK